EPRYASSVYVRISQHMRCNVTVGIDALVFLHKADAGQSKMIDRLLLRRGYGALDPDEPFARTQLLPQFLCVHVRQYGCQKINRLIPVDDASWIRVNRSDLDVGRQNLPVAVENVGTRRCHSIRGAT